MFILTGRLNALAFDEGETRFQLSAEQTIAGASERGVSEDFPLDGPRSLYGMTKLAGELMVAEYADAYGIRCLIDRCGLLTGPWQMAKSDQGVIALWMAAHYFRRDLSYIGFDGSGRQVRDFLHIDDFCDLLLEQIGDFETYQGGLFNVGGGLECSLSLLETTRLCEEITGTRLSIAPVAQTRPADVRIYLTDHRRLSAVNGWRPQRRCAHHADRYLRLDSRGRGAGEVRSNWKVVDGTQAGDHHRGRPRRIDRCLRTAHQDRHSPHRSREERVHGRASRARSTTRAIGSTWAGTGSFPSRTGSCPGGSRYSRSKLPSKARRLSNITA